MYACWFQPGNAAQHAPSISRPIRPTPSNTAFCCREPFRESTACRISSTRLSESWACSPGPGWLSKWIEECYRLLDDIVELKFVRVTAGPTEVQSKRNLWSDQTPSKIDVVFSSKMRPDLAGLPFSLLCFQASTSMARSSRARCVLEST